MKDGKQKGMFKDPVAIAVNVDDLVIADNERAIAIMIKNIRIKI